MEKRERGLTSGEAVKRLEKYGPNELPQKKQALGLRLLFEQFKSPLVYILLFAAGVTLLLGDFTDTVVILIAVFLNTILGFYQEAKAERALAALQGMLTAQAKVVRDGKTQLVGAETLVPGDLVVVGQGDRVPADGVLIEAVSLSVNEAILTGESVPVSKDVHEGGLSRQSASDVFMGTTVASGRGRFLVTATGESSQMGTIAKELVVVEEEKTPLQKRLARLAATLAKMVALISIGILIVGLVSGNSFIEMFTTSVAIAVAAIPEGMIVALTVILAIGMQRILKKKALVRRLVAAETLGSVTVIATDKTGTLTEGVMRVSKFELVDRDEAIRTSVFANNLEDPLEVALWEWAEKQGIDPQRLTDENKRQRETPFNSDAKFMSVTVDRVLYIKGAPEVVLKMSDIEKNERKKWEQMIEEWAGEGLRLIGVSRDKRWLGLIGIEDPVRRDVGTVFERCISAGIRVVMITGDYAGTAMSVWKKVQNSHKEPAVIDGAELSKIPIGELGQKISEIDIFARVTPSQKLDIVKALQRSGEVVALVGDGVNDAPAIKQADIGVVVGGASDVARETADMVLLDSNFKTIVAAISEGRGIFENIKKVILYLLSDSFSEVILVTSSILLGLPLPLTAAQILYINLITDGFPNVALTVEPKERGLMKRHPISLSRPLIDVEMKALIGIISVITGVTSLYIFMYFWGTYDLQLARTVTFAALGVDSLLYVFSVRSLSQPIWSLNHLVNPYLLFAVGAGLVLQIVALYHPLFNAFLQTVPLGLSEWIVVLGVSGLVIVMIEVTKLAFNLKKSTAR